MDTQITIADVAKYAGVSTATAGRVVGGYGNVSEKSREKVLKALLSAKWPDIPPCRSDTFLSSRTVL